jgi:hypothetical protein
VKTEDFVLIACYTHTTKTLLLQNLLCSYLESSVFAFMSEILRLWSSLARLQVNASSASSLTAGSKVEEWYAIGHCL